MSIGPQAIVAGNNVSWDEMVARHRAGAGLWRHGAEEQRCRRRRDEPAYRARIACAAARRRGAEFHLISPLRDDLPADVEAVWHPIRPGTDTALMLGLAHTLVSRETA